MHTENTNATTKTRKHIWQIRLNNGDKMESWKNIQIIKIKQKRREIEKKKTGETIENNQQVDRLKPNHINNHIKCKCPKDSN